MQTGDVIRDAQGRSYQIGPLLGCGSSGKTFLVRQESTGSEYALKCTLAKEDLLPEEAEDPRLLSACREALLEQGRLLEEGRHPFLCPIYTRFTTAEGTPVLILPLYKTTLEQRIAQSCTLSEVLGVLIQLCEHLQALLSTQGQHGNLHPGNILLNEQGEVFLTDVATAASRKVQFELSGRPRNPYLPAEVTRPEPRLLGRSGADTYAIGMMLYQAVISFHMRETASGEQPVLPSHGLDKLSLMEVRNQVLERLKEESSNPRFHNRLARKVSSFLDRAISRLPTPSPPYRFHRIDEVLERLRELQSLIEPELSGVSRIMLDRPGSTIVFTSEEPILFAMNMRTPVQLNVEEDLFCGLAVYDASNDVRLRDLPSAYTVKKQPTGFYRALFRIDRLPAAHYQIKVALGIREGNNAPTIAKASFEVVPGEPAVDSQPELQLDPEVPPSEAEPSSISTRVPSDELGLNLTMPEPTPIAPPELDPLANIPLKASASSAIPVRAELAPVPSEPRWVNPAPLSTSGLGEPNMASLPPEQPPRRSSPPYSNPGERSRDYDDYVNPAPPDTESFEDYGHISEDPSWDDDSTPWRRADFFQNLLDMVRKDPWIALMFGLSIVALIAMLLTHFLTQ